MEIVARTAVVLQTVLTLGGAGIDDVSGNKDTDTVAGGGNGIAADLRVSAEIGSHV